MPRGRPRNRSAPTLPVSSEDENVTQNANTSAADDSNQGAAEAAADNGSQPSGCTHYVRRCALVTPCCNKLYQCHVCHDDKESHKLDRSTVSEIICVLCNTKQAVGQSCVSCGTEFGKYFCAVCRLYDDTDKRQFHCDECGICRLHGRHNYFHCPTCDTCLHVDMKGKHHCVEKVSQGRCTVCLEDLHNSRESIRTLQCGHLLHKKCFKDLLRSKIYSCPVCCRSMIEMEGTWRELEQEIAETQMPGWMRRLVRISCRDCGQISNVLEHIVGLRCNACGSFNTRRMP